MPDLAAVTPSLPSTYTIYLAGTTVKARNNRTGLVDVATSDNTVDAVPTFNAAINNIQNIAGIDANHGASIYILSGKYKCITELAATIENSGRHSINIVGEGKGTHLSFEPTTTLTNAIHLRMNFPRLAHLMVVANENVVNLVKGAGPTTAAQYNWGVMEHVTLCGPDSTIPTGGAGTIRGTVKDAGPPIVYYTPVSGQVGLLLQGTHDSDGYFTANWKITNCEFFALDVGVKVYGQFADMCNHNNIHCGSCNTAYILEGAQHNLNNFRIEGGGGPQADQVGDIGIWLRESTVPGNESSGDIHMLSNINIELHKSTSKGILLDTGVDNTRMSNIHNSSGDNMSSFTIWENAKVPGINSLDIRNQSINRISQDRSRTGSITFGSNKRGTETGILMGNVDTVVNGVANADLTTRTFANGPFGSLVTSTTVNDVACIYYNNSLGNRINAATHPELFVRFFPDSLTDVRIFMGLWTIPFILAVNPFAAPVSTGASFDLLANRRGMGLYLDTSVSSNWKIMHNDASASSTIADFPTQTIGNTTYGPNAITSSFVQAVTVSFNNTNPSCSVKHWGLGYDFKTTNIPSADNFGFLIYIENLTAGTQRTLRLFDIEYSLTEI